MQTPSPPPQSRLPFAKTFRKIMGASNPWSLWLQSVCVILLLVCLVAFIPFGSSIAPSNTSSNTTVERSINTFDIENDLFAGNVPSLGNAWSIMPNQTSPCRHSFYEGTIRTHTTITPSYHHRCHRHHLTVTYSTNPATPPLTHSVFLIFN